MSISIDTGNNTYDYLVSTGGSITTGNNTSIGTTWTTGSYTYCCDTWHIHYWPYCSHCHCNSAPTTIYKYQIICPEDGTKMWAEVGEIVKCKKCKKRIKVILEKDYDLEIPVGD